MWATPKNVHKLFVVPIRNPEWYGNFRIPVPPVPFIRKYMAYGLLSVEKPVVSAAHELCLTLSK